MARDGHIFACFVFRVAFRCGEIFEDFSKISALVYSIRYILTLLNISVKIFEVSSKILPQFISGGIFDSASLKEKL